MKTSSLIFFSTFFPFCNLLSSHSGIFFFFFKTCNFRTCNSHPQTPRWSFMALQGWSMLLPTALLGQAWLPVFWSLTRSPLIYCDLADASQPNPTSGTFALKSSHCQEHLPQSFSCPSHVAPWESPFLPTLLKIIPSPSSSVLLFL